MITYKVYKGHDSPFTHTITDLLDARYSSSAMAGITRAYLKYVPATGEDAEFADSNDPTHTAVFDWTTYAASGIIVINLGMLGLTEGRDRTAELVIYDATYTNGRVVTQLDVLVSEEAYDGVSAIGVLGALPITLNVTDDYTITSASFGGSVRASFATEKTLTLPSVGADDDGERVTIIKTGSGNVAVTCSDSDKIASGSHTTLTGTSTYAAITLEYVHAITTWVVMDGSGSWSGS